MATARPIRHARWLILLLPVLVTVTAIAQGGPPPLGPLPPPPVPPGNPITTAKINLGKVLFWDEQLSSTRTVACGSCHQGRSGGGDPRSVAGAIGAVNPGPDGVQPSADDVTGSPGVSQSDGSGAYAWSATYGLLPQVTPRLANSHINAGYAPELFWDGRAGRALVDPVSGDTVLFANAALESQALAPPASSVEMGHLGRDWPNVVARVAVSAPLRQAPYVPADLASWIGGRTYPQLFQEAFGTPVVTASRIAMAIATYERSLVSNQAPIDSAIAGTAVQPPNENAGRALFGGLGCAGCHAGPLFSDNLFHYIGESPAAEDSGRAKVTGLPQNLGQMKTPSLRNVGLRTSYFHDGRFHTLEDVVAFYNRGGDFNAPNKPPVIRPLGLGPVQQQQLVAFLRRTLTDTRVANQTAPFDRPSLYSESDLVPVIEGGGAAGAGGFLPRPVALEPPITGNPDFTIAVQGALGGAGAVLVVDANPPGLLGGIPETGSFTRIETTLQGSGAGAGYGSVDLAIPDDVALQGQVLYARWYVTDAAAAGGVAASPLVRLRLFGTGAAGTLAVDGAPAAPRALVLHTNMPNPFRSGGTSIRYDLFGPTPVKLVVYDAQGRAVRRLIDERLQASGSHAVTWDGRDEQGRAMPGGVYFARVDAGASSQTRRVVKID